MSTINIANYQFSGPFTSSDELKNQSGVYVILGKNNAYDQWSPVDAGEAGQVRDRVANHDRKPCWTGQNYKILGAAVYYTDERGRMALERIVRGAYHFPCGVR